MQSDQGNSGREGQASHLMTHSRSDLVFPPKVGAWALFRELAKMLSYVGGGRSVQRGRWITVTNRKETELSKVKGSSGTREAARYWVLIYCICFIIMSGICASL